MSDNLPISPPEGSATPPVAPSEPSGAAAPAPAVTPSAPPAAISSPAPATGTAAPTAPSSTSADQAFAELMADPTAHDNPFPAQPPAQPQQPAAPPAPAQPPPQQPIASEPPAPEAENAEPEPTQAETQEGKVPVKKLLRALEVRRKALTEAEAAKQQLAQEQALTNRVLNAFHAAGIDANSLPAFMANLARHRNDPQAQAQLLASLGVQAPQPTAQVDLAAVKARLEAYDAEGALALLNGQDQAQPTAPATPNQAPPAPPLAQPPAAAQPQQPNVLIQTVATMGAVLRDTYGEQEASRLAGLIDAEAKAQIQAMDDLGAVVTPEAAAKVWRKAQGTVLRAQQQNRASPVSTPTNPNPPQAPAPAIRPAQQPAPRKLTADEEFAQLQARGF